MAISYSEALHCIRKEAQAHSGPITQTVPLRQSLNRVSKCTYCSPESTPKCDLSAMDGYALNSEATLNASAQNTVTFCVKATIAAGEEPIAISTQTKEGIHPAVEIMTGACFPSSLSGKPFDCCVRIEDTEAIHDEVSGCIYIRVFKPAKRNQHKRQAGEDFAIGDVIIEENSIIRPRHIMALASVGIDEVVVSRLPRIALFSTGSELRLQDGSNSHAGLTKDVNGPYISATLDDFACDVDFHGVVEDSSIIAAQRISEALEEQKYDLLITTGGVSAGKFDYIKEAIEKVDGEVLFHKVAMRPGHPTLFATIPCLNGHIPFFGLPGNPVASAACLRFLVVPFLQALLYRQLERPSRARLRVQVDPGKRQPHKATMPPSQNDVFRAGKILHGAEGYLEVEVISDHSPGKIKPFLGADCWVHIPSGSAELTDGDPVDIYLLDHWDAHISGNLYPFLSAP